MNSLPCGRPLAAILVLTSLLLAGCAPQADSRSGTPAKAKAGSSELQIRVLSNRADLVSGGDALVEVILPEGKSATELKADINGRDVSKQLELRGNGRTMGLITDLAEGLNTLTVTAGDLGAAIDLTNHPNGGPIFAGEQIQHGQTTGDLLAVAACFFE